MSKIDQMKTPLFDAVKRYVENKVIPFHVPGHKQGRGIDELREYVGERVLQMDANGMEDLDYANSPTGVIRESQKLMAKAFGAEEAYFLVNGTTAGVQAMMMSACQPGDQIIRVAAKLSHGYQSRYPCDSRYSMTAAPPSCGLSHSVSTMTSGCSGSS